MTNSGSNSVSMYSIDSATGTLTLIGTLATETDADTVVSGTLVKGN